MKKLFVLTLLLLAIASSTAQQPVTYMFPVNKDITICPLITRSSSTSRPNFRLEPFSVRQNDLFLRGTYGVPDTTILGADFVFERENNSCTNNPAFTCFKLSLRYRGNAPPDPRRGSFTITYTGDNGITRSIHVNFGYAGAYLRDESAGLVVGRAPNTTILNNSLVLFGTPTRLVTCLENGTEAPSNFLSRITVNFSNEECFRNDQPNSQPGLFRLTISANRTGREMIYFGDSNCSDGNRISETFLFIFDPPATEGPGPTTTQPPGFTTTQPTSPGLPLGAVIGAAVAVALLSVTAVVLLAIIFIWKWRKWRRGVTLHNGSMGTHGLPSGLEGLDGGLSHSPELHGDQNERAPLVPVAPQLQPPPPQPPRRELYIVLSTDHEKVEQLREKLYGCFSGFHSASLPRENGTFEQDLTRIVNRQDVVIILGDIGEIHANQSSSGRKWVTTFLGSAAFRKEQLRHVFYVRFGTSEVIPGYMEKLQQITVQEQPNDNIFDPAYVAKFIQERIGEIMNSHSRNQLNQQNHLEAHPSTPQLPSPNRHSTSDLGSELSETSWKGASNENKTENEETHNTDRELADTNNTQVPPMNPAVARLRASSHGSGGLESASNASVRTTGRSDGEGEGGELRTDKLAHNTASTGDLQSSSATSIALEAFMGEMGKKIIDNLEKKMDKVGKDVVEKVEGAVETVGKNIEGAVATVGEDVKNVGGAVETLGGNLENERAEMKDRMDGMEQDIDHAMGVTESVQIKLDSETFKTIHPHSDDVDKEDNEGSETGDLGTAAAAREDTT